VSRNNAGTSALALGALGVVFGDIGTSPLYALQAAFSESPSPAVTHANILGILSLFFWSLVVVVTLKYVLFVMRANNRGEGGIMALMALARQRALGWERGAVVVLGLLGVALFYGDGAITPAISVLSAVEGTRLVTTSLHSYVVPIAVVVLTALFLVQRYGSERIGNAFGPIMVTWFVVIGALGLRGIWRNPSVLRALDPLEAVSYITRQPWVAFVSLGAVVLCITGVEALYADMGHFGRMPIATAWLLVVLPSLTLCYFGQGALILQDPTRIANPFFFLAPHALLVPLVILATIATVVASQAVISGAFSLTQQAIQLGYLPRMTIRHTSDQVRGQIYVPIINWLLFLAVLLLVIGFGSSVSLAAAYGIAVTGTMAATTVLAYVVTRRVWNWPAWQAALVVIPFLAIDLAFFSSNLLKIHHGGWFPLLVAAMLYVLMTTWDRGRALITERRTAKEGPLREYIANLDPRLLRAPGTAIYLNASAETTPLALQHNIERNHLRHEHVIIVRVVTLEVPHVADDAGVTIDDLGDPDDRITLVTGSAGFRDSPDVPAMLRTAAEMSPEIGDLEHPTYYLSRITIRPCPDGHMAMWRKQLFAGLAKNAANPAEFFSLPPDDVASIGSSIDL
jgi:KUP system potassium uptake protein